MLLLLEPVLHCDGKFSRLWIFVARGAKFWVHMGFVFDLFFHVKHVFCLFFSFFLSILRKGETPLGYAINSENMRSHWRITNIYILRFPKQRIRAFLPSCSALTHCLMMKTIFKSKMIGIYACFMMGLSIQIMFCIWSAYGNEYVHVINWSWWCFQRSKDFLMIFEYTFQ